MRTNTRRLEHYFGDMLSKQAIARIRRSVRDEKKKKPTKREVDDAVREVMKELGIKRTTLMYGANRGEDARYV